MPCALLDPVTSRLSLDPEEALLLSRQDSVNAKVRSGTVSFHLSHLC